MLVGLLVFNRPCGLDVSKFKIKQMMRFSKQAQCDSVFMKLFHGYPYKNVSEKSFCKN